MYKLCIAVFAVFMLTACGNNEQDQVNNAQIIEEGTVGFEVLGGNIEEVTGIPTEEKEAILTAFEEYISSFNSKDIDRYVKTLSENPQGFSIEDDKTAAQTAFEQYNITKTPSEITIVKYNEQEAQVYSNMITDLMEVASGNELQDAGRQVTVFVKENGEWKVTSIYYIGNQS
jgi:hypothetical protein